MLKELFAGARRAASMILRGLWKVICGCQSMLDFMENTSDHLLAGMERNELRQLEKVEDPEWRESIARTIAHIRRLRGLA